jgi:hypothetical protein
VEAGCVVLGGAGSTSVDSMVISDAQCCWMSVGVGKVSWQGGESSSPGGRLVVSTSESTSGGGLELDVLAGMGGRNSQVQSTPGPNAEGSSWVWNGSVGSQSSPSGPYVTIWA